MFPHRPRRKVRVVTQASMAECGLVCLAMVLDAYGCSVAVREIRTEIDTGRDGASMLQLAKYARSLGLVTRAFRLSAEAIDEALLPAIVSWKPSHFVVVEGVRGDVVTLVDPAAGRLTLSREEFREHFGMAALTFERGEDFIESKRPRLNFVRFVAPFFPRSPGRISLIVALAFVLFALALVPPAISKYIFDNVLPSSDVAPLAGIAVALCFLTAGYFTSSMFRSELLLWLETKLDSSLMSGFLSRLFSLPYRYFQIRQIGDILTRVSSTAYVRDVLSSRLLSVMIDSVFLLGYAAIIFAQSAVVGSLVMSIAVVEICVILLMAARAQRLTERELAEMASAQSVLLETVRGVEMIKSSGLEGEAISRWSAGFAGQLHASIARRRLDNLLTGFLTTLSFVMPPLLLLVGAYLVINRALTLGQAVALNALAGAALAPIATLGVALQSLMTARVHIERLRDILDEDPESNPGEGEFKTLSGAVSVEGVMFSYGGNSRPALQDLDFSLAAGEFVAVIGPSGSGKSTLARTIVGLLKPTEGRVLFDGSPVDELDLRGIRQQCGVVTQSSDAVSGSIRSNIEFGRPWVTEEDVQRAVAIAVLERDIAAMPLGLDTPLGEAGIGLSGGQLQRLAIARAVAAAPKILLLDEATSHLDAWTEARLCTNLDELSCTRIVIAHRLSTIIAADRILFLDDGRLRLVGSHEDLLEHEAYSDFFRSQLTGSPGQGKNDEVR